MSFQLRPASKVQLKARLALVGPSGSGKTYSALEAAMALTGSIGKVAVIDTERGSAALYADEFGEFMHGVLDPPYSPAAYLNALTACAEAGAEVVVIDSLSHAWSGQGGVLEIVDDAATRNRGNKFDAWREGTPEQNKLVDTVMRWPGHVIVTMRAKTEYVVEEDERGKTKVRKLGLAPEQRKGMEYEFDLVADIDHDHRLMVSKSRFTALQDAVEKKADRTWWGPFVEWLNRGDTVQQQVATRLASFGFTDDQQAFIVGRYQQSATSPDDLTGAVAGKMLAQLADDDVVAKIRAAILEQMSAEPEPDPDPVDDVPDACVNCGVAIAGEHECVSASEAETAERRAAAADATAAATGGVRAPTELEDALLASTQGADVVAEAEGDTPYDWRAHMNATDVKLLDVIQALRDGWPANSQWNMPNRTRDVDKLCDDPDMAKLVEAVIGDLADKAVA